MYRVVVLFERYQMLTSIRNRLTARPLIPAVRCAFDLLDVLIVISTESDSVDDDRLLVHIDNVEPSQASVCRHDAQPLALKPLPIGSSRRHTAHRMYKLIGEPLNATRMLHSLSALVVIIQGLLRARAK
jgi:hypothetical protein